MAGQELFESGSTDVNPMALRRPIVAIIMGSDSDIPIMEGAIKILEKFDVPFEVKILSAHRTPNESADYAKGLVEQGIKVLIAGAGWAAHLAGAMAAHTTIPVIGVPIDSSPLNGMDALLATAQMPPGIPVATMSIGKGGANNAALFAIQILALSDFELANKFAVYKKKMAEDVIGKKNQDLQDYLRNRILG